MLREGASEYAALITLEMGKPLAESPAEIEKCAKVCEFYADRATAFLADEPVKSNAAESFIVFDPLGVFLQSCPGIILSGSCSDLQPRPWLPAMGPY